MVVYVWFLEGNYDRNLRYEINKKPFVFQYENITFMRIDCLNNSLGSFDDSGKVLLVNGGDCEIIPGFDGISHWVRGDSTKAFGAFKKD